MERASLALGTMFFGTRVDEPTSNDLLDRFVAAHGETSKDVLGLGSASLRSARPCGPATPAPSPP